MVNIKIGLATDSMSFTPTPVYSSSNGYAYVFANGQPFTDIIEESSPSIATGYTYGTRSRTNTFKLNVSGSMAQIKAIERYNNIVVYKNDVLAFCGYNPTFSKNIKKGVGSNGRAESWVEASVSFDDYSSKLNDIRFSNDESFELFFSQSDAIKVCSPATPAKSLVHILLGYLDPNNEYTKHYGEMPSLISDTVVTYFCATYQDKVLDVFDKVLEQAGLGYYFDKKHIYIFDILEEYTGTAINIPNIEESAVRKGRSFVELKVPEIRVASPRVLENTTIYDSGNMVAPRNSWYPSSDMYIEGSFSCKRQDKDNPDGKADDEQEKRFFNIQSPSWYGETNPFETAGAWLKNYSSSKTGVKYQVLNDSIWNRKFQLQVKGDVLLFKYATGFRPSDNWDGDKKDCDYIFSAQMAQRYANALLYQKKTDAVYYEFYADTTSEYPDGFPLNAIVTLQGTDEANPLMLITSKTDKFDSFGGYVYKAVPYDRSGIALSPSFVPSQESLPSPDNRFTVSLSRDIVECYSNRTPLNDTPVLITVNIKNRLAVPVLTIDGVTVSMHREKTEVSESGTTYLADTDNWIYELDANLNGNDTTQVAVEVDGIVAERTVAKLVPNDSIEPDIIVPKGYTLVKQYCYGDKNGPDPQAVADANYELGDAIDLVSDIYWVDAVDGSCPLKPRSGLYIWMRQGIYDPSLSDEPDGWVTSMYDTPYLRFDFSVSQTTYNRNLRDRLSINEIFIYPNLVGYDASALIVTASNKSGALPFDKNNQRYILEFEYQYAPEDMVKITASLGAKEWSFDLKCIDLTEMHAYFGICESAPNTVSLDGDSYVVGDPNSPDYLKVMVYSETDNLWHYLSDPDIALEGITVSEISAKASKDVLENIEIGTLTKSDYAYFNTLIAGVVTADFIGSKQIQIQSDNGNAGVIFGQGQDGAVDLTQPAGERTSGKSFVVDSEGNAEFSQAYLKNAKITGDLDLNDADIIHDCFTTVSPQGSDLSDFVIGANYSASGVNLKPTHWCEKDVSFASLTANVFSSVSSSYYGSTNINRICRCTDRSTVLVTNDIRQVDPDYGEYYCKFFDYRIANNTGTWTVPETGNYKLSATPSSSYIFGTKNTCWVYVNGQCVLTATGGHNTGYAPSWPATTRSLKKGDVVTWIADVGYGGSTSKDKGWFCVFVNHATIADSGISSNGDWWEDTSYNWHKLDKTGSSSSYKAKATVLYINGYFNSDDSSSNYKNIKYLTLADIISSYMNANSLVDGKAYHVSGTLLKDGSTTLYPKYITKNGTSGQISCITAGNAEYNITMSSSVFYQISGSFHIKATSAGLVTANVYPKADDTYAIGDPNNYYSEIFVHTVHSGSKRSLKTNIIPFEGNGLEIIKSVDVVKYNFKRDVETKPAEKITDYIGFIADDTDTHLSGKNHDEMIQTNCIGVLIKAVQELNAKVEELTRRING